MRSSRPKTDDVDRSRRGDVFGLPRLAPSHEEAVSIALPNPLSARWLRQNNCARTIPYLLSPHTCFTASPTSKQTCRANQRKALQGHLAALKVGQIEVRSGSTDAKAGLPRSKTPSASSEYGGSLRSRHVAGCFHSLYSFTGVSRFWYAGYAASTPFHFTRTAAVRLCTGRCSLHLRPPNLSNIHPSVTTHFRTRRAGVALALARSPQRFPPQLPQPQPGIVQTPPPTPRARDQPETTRRRGRSVIRRVVILGPLPLHIFRLLIVNETAVVTAVFLGHRRHH